jgi:hypothetical protein
MMNAELKALLLSMSVPPKRVAMNDVGWFIRNLGIQNADHPNFKRAMELLKSDIGFRK